MADGKASLPASVAADAEAEGAELVAFDGNVGDSGCGPDDFEGAGLVAMPLRSTVRQGGPSNMVLFGVMTSLRSLAVGSTT